MVVPESSTFKRVLLLTAMYFLSAQTSLLPCQASGVAGRAAAKRSGEAQRTAAGVADSHNAASSFKQSGAGSSGVTRHRSSSNRSHSAAAAHQTPRSSYYIAGKVPLPVAEEYRMPVTHAAVKQTVKPSQFVPTLMYDSAPVSSQ